MSPFFCVLNIYMYRKYCYKIVKDRFAFFPEPFDTGHHLGTGYTNHDDYFLLISKNASTTIRRKLEECKWKYCLRPPLESKTVHAILRDPFERWLSGISEFLCNGNYEKDMSEIFKLIESKTYIEMISEIGIFDGHTVPQTWYLSNLQVDKVKFYKFDETVVQRMFKNLNIDGAFMDEKVSNNAPYQSEIKNIVKDQIIKHDLKEKILSHYLTNDLLLIKSIKKWL